jgi:hypothetical protein
MQSSAGERTACLAGSPEHAINAHNFLKKRHHVWHTFYALAYLLILINQPHLKPSDTFLERALNGSAVEIIINCDVNNFKIK